MSLLNTEVCINRHHCVFTGGGGGGGDCLKKIDLWQHYCLTSADTDVMCGETRNQHSLGLNCFYLLAMIFPICYYLILFSAKPIDLLAQYVSADGDDDLSVEMQEPYNVLKVCTRRIEEFFSS